jgi:hypothetical protein
VRIGNTKRIFGWRQLKLIPATAAILLLQGCTDYFVKEGHLSNNPMDEAIRTGISSYHMKETRDRILKRFRPGQPVVELSRYLESVGAKCRTPEGAGKIVTCRYSQYTDLVFRTPFGESLEYRDTSYFRIELMHQRGLFRDVRVCRRITRIRYKGTLTDYSERAEFPMKCSKEPDKKGK